MFTHIVVLFILLLLASFFLKKVMAQPKNIVILFFCQPLVMAGSPVIIFIGGILSNKITPDARLSTLPITLMILGVASFTVPAAFIAKQKGRKFAAIAGFSFALLAMLLAAYAAQTANFILFSMASLFFGMSSAFVQQLRFAAIESTANKEDIPKTLSLLMLSGLFAAFLGPEVAVAAQYIIDSPHGFTGSFLILALFIILALVVVSFFDEPAHTQDVISGEERPTSVLLKQPLFIIAILSAAIGYALMSYLMTATPISMHQLNNHSLQDTKWVIQSHIAAMFLPSLFSGWLISKWGLKKVLFSGTVIYALVITIAFAGEQVIHYWWALVLLGVGWNFLFLTGTSLLPSTYRSAERHKVQAINDFILFALQALASLLAGWVLFNMGWYVVVISSMPFVVILFLTSYYFYRIEAKV